LLVDLYTSINKDVFVRKNETKLPNYRIWKRSIYKH
jgi:hypothetical protein